MRYLLSATRAVSILAVVAVGASSTVAAAKDVSGVVKPKVTILAPKEVKGKISIVQYPVPARYATPYGVAIDSKNRVWCTLMSGNSLAVLDPATNEFKEYRIPSTEGLPDSDWKYDTKDRTVPKKAYNVFSVGSPGSIIVAKNGDIWFVMLLGNSVVRFNPTTEEFTEIILPTTNAQPYDLAEDSAGRIWFIEKNTSKIGYLDPATKKITEIPISPGSNMMGIAVDPSGQVWVSEVNGNYIGRYDPKSRKFRPFVIPTLLAQPGKIIFDGDSKLWFCAPHSRQIGVFYTNGADRNPHFGMVDVPGYNAAPQALAPAKDGKIWYIDSMMNMIGFFDQGKATWSSFEIPSHGAQPMGIAVDLKGDIWFTESDRGVNQISRVLSSSVPAQAVSDVNEHVGSSHSH